MVYFCRYQNAGLKEGDPYTVKSDIYFFGTLLNDKRALIKNDVILKKLLTTTMHTDPKKRPTTDKIIKLFTEN